MLQSIQQFAILLENSSIKVATTMQ